MARIILQFTKIELVYRNAVFKKNNNRYSVWRGQCVMRHGCAYSGHLRFDTLQGRVMTQTHPGCSTWRPDFDPGPVHVRFVVGKIGTETGLSPSTSVYPLSVSFHECSIIIYGLFK